MAAIHTTTGIVTKTSKNCSIVAITIDGSSRSFIFSKTIFYVFGLTCDGEMTNILEEAMEVDVCYKIFHLNNKPSLVAVWLGDKPDFLDENTVLKAVYDEDGLVINLVDLDDFIIQNNNFTVLVNGGVVFRDGLPLDGDGAPVDVGGEIKYDAVPLDFEHPSGALYQATCAWIGAKPKIVERFKLQLPCRPEDETELCNKELVYGTVTVIPNEVVAFVDVEVESGLVKVLVFGDSFEERCGTIQEMITLGDILCMRVASCCLFRNRPQWYAKRACKVNQEIISDTVEIIPDKFEEFVGECSELTSSEFDEESDVLFRDPPLTGVLSGVQNGSGACITYKNLHIFVEIDNFFVNGKPCSDLEFSSWVSNGVKSVNFEAVSSKLSPKNKTEFTHQACCVWVGKKPTVKKIMASLPQDDLGPFLEEEKIFYGVVKKLLLPSAALAVLPGRMTTVLVRVDEFLSGDNVGGTNLITDYVKLGDNIEFNVRKQDKTLLAFDVRFATFTVEVCERMNLGLLASSNERPCSEKAPGEGNVVLSPASKIVSSPKSKTRTAAQQNDVTTASKVVDASDAEIATAIPFKTESRFSGCGYSVNCVGTLIVTMVGSKVRMFVDHYFGSTEINLPFTPGNINLLGTDSEKLKLSGRQIRFDAKCVSTAEGKYDFTILKMWRQNERRFDSDNFLARYSYFSESVDNSFHVGQVESIPLPDRAVVSAKHVNVIVSLESLITCDEINLFTSSIDQFLSLGDFVFMMIEKKSDSSCGEYYRAVKCFKIKKKGEISLDDNVEITVPRTVMIMDVWGFGEYFRTGKIVQKKDKFYVDFVSSRNPNLSLSLNLFKKGNVFVHGVKLTEPEMILPHVGSEITFHVANKPFSGVVMFVGCAWIGSMPPAKMILKDSLAVPKGLVRSGSCYEAVVDSFPLPTHAVCFIGYVPVLVEVAKFDEEKGLVELVKNLKKGDRIYGGVQEINARKISRGVQEINTRKISGGVQEINMGNLSVIVTMSGFNLCTSVTDAQCKGVYRNLIGTVVGVPDPVGLIKAAKLNIAITFELCHVRTGSKNVKPADRQCWFDYLREEITVGKQVYFSATKDMAKNTLFRALDVYLVDESSDVYSNSY